MSNNFQGDCSMIIDKENTHEENFHQWANDIRKIRKKIISKPWKCMYPCCNNLSINSHYLQQIGILDKVSSDHNYIMIKPMDIMRCNGSTLSYDAKTIGIKQTLALPIFCDSHDSKLFRNIETKPIDFEDYNSSLLFCYRTLCGELRKLQMCLEEILALYECKTSKFDIDIEYDAKLMEQIDCLHSLKCEIEKELFIKKEEFVFKHLIFPKLEIFASGIIGGKTTPHGFCLCFIHIIPQEDTLHIILGYSKKHIDKTLLEYVNKWCNLEKNTLGIMITDLFSQKIENIGMSKSLYEKIGVEKIRKVCEIISQRKTPTEWNFIGNENIFKDVM